MNPFMLAALVVGLIGLTLGTGLGYAWKAWRGGKGWRNIGATLTLTLPDIPGTLATLSWDKTPGGYMDKDSNEPGAVRGDKDRVVPAGPAAYPTNWGPLNVLSSSGYSLVAPSKLEAAKTIEAVYVADWITTHKRLPNKEEAATTFSTGLQEAQARAAQLAKRFMVWDPRAYWKACRESVMQKLYQSQGGVNDPWYAKAAFFAVLVVGVLLLGVLGVLMVKVLPAIQAGTGP